MFRKTMLVLPLISILAMIPASPNIESMSCGMIRSAKAWADNYWVRLDFEDRADSEILSDQYAQFGIQFQKFGTGNGTPSFISFAAQPFGSQIDLAVAPPLGLYEVGIVCFNTPLANERHINFAQPASHVSFWYNQTLNTPTFLRGRVKIYDGLSATGSILHEKVFPFVAGEKAFFGFNSVTKNINSFSITTSPPFFAFDDLIIDSGTAPKGGNIIVSSDQDTGAAIPRIFLEGNTAFLGTPRGASPKTILSVNEGKHLVSLYAPGFEWSQFCVDVVTGQDTMGACHNATCDRSYL